MKKRSFFTYPTIVIYLNSSVQALLFALVLPTLSYYVTEKFKVDAFLVGTFFILIAATGILFSQLLGHLSDKLSDRRPLIIMGMLSGALACYLFSTAQTYEMALIAGISSFSLSFASISQTFAHARDYAEQNFERSEVVMFNTILRAFAAFSWVSGPALGFISIGYFDFNEHYLLIALLYLSGAIFSWFILPETIKTPSNTVAETGNSTSIITIAFIAFSLVFSCNQTYLIALPLYITKELALDVSWSGWLMGTAAAIEIPIMIFAGWLGTRFALSSLVCIGAIAPIFLYLGFWKTDELWVLFPLQIGNALMIGFIAGLGMTWFQDLMPNRIGTASALFWNSTNMGNIIGAVIIATFGQLLGYRDLYLINAGIAMVASVLLIYVALKSKKHQYKQVNI
jgi:SET family sugar efflux transporter-like MFS transporter